MPGMNSGLNPADPTIVAAFRSALVHQWAIVALIFVLLLVAWGATRAWAGAHGAGAAGSPARWHEPRARRLLRVGFGILWVFDGILQAQPQMAGGLPQEVIKPAAATSPAWVQHLVNWGGSIWTYHPIQAGAATVWIQVGIGMWLIFAPRGWSSRLAGLASAGWGLVVWAFGEAFGGIFAPGLTVLFGAPGAVLIYAVAGALVALPERAWESPRTGRLTLAGTGVFFLGMALLQAWPGRGFWNGTPVPGGTGGTLSGMESQMAQLSQPQLTASWVRAFGTFATDHGWIVNFVVVVALLGIGVCFLTLRPAVVRVGVIAGSVLCLATWVLVQDFGFFGGVGTDPNSMIPMLVVFTSGYLAMVRLPARSAAGTPVADEPMVAPPPVESLPVGVGVADGGTVGHAAPAAAAAAADSPVADSPASPGQRLLRLSPSYLVRSIAAVGAVAIVLVGAAPMALASTNPNADPIINAALNGSPNLVNSPAPGFTLVDQAGTAVTLHSLAGKAVVLTFLDPTCTSDCPLIAQELRVADAQLGADAAKVQMVAIVNNPLYTSPAATAAFDRQEGMGQLANWSFLTGPLPDLQQAWNSYGVQTAISPAGGMVAHSDLVFLIDGSGRLRVVLTSDPGGQGDAALHSSFSSTVVRQVRQLVGG